MKPSKTYSILYVDDEVANLRSFKALFRRNYNVQVAENAADGMDLVRKHKFDLVVSDHKLPHLIGTDFLKEVSRYDGNIRRVILSGFVNKEELIAANDDFGLHAFISTPWEYDSVNLIFEKLLSESKSPIMNYK